MSDSWGKLFHITVFGESHGPCVGVVIEGCPAGLPLAEEDIQTEVEKRQPVTGAGQTARLEEDKVEVLSGVFRGYTTGAPLGLLVWNRDTDPGAYETLQYLPRPGHADYTARRKYGGFNDYRGGGRFSGRLTVGLVMAGAVARKMLGRSGIEIMAHTVQIGHVKSRADIAEITRRKVYSNPLRCADPEAERRMSALIEQVALEGDSLGGLIEGLVLNVPPGLGEPYFDTLEGELAKALFAIPAVKGVEFGAGFGVVEKKGSENNDPFIIRDNRVLTETNNAGGILGGISDGMPLVVRVAVKPTPSISKKQRTVDIREMQSAELSITGRHDVCVVPRAVIVVESMLAVTLCDMALRAGLIARIVS
jgi:chorismate synthase